MHAHETPRCRPRAHPEDAPHERRGALQEDVVARRGKLMERLGPDHARHLLECSHARLLRRRRLRVPPREQPPVSDGHRSAEPILVVMPGNTSQREILFIREADARRDHWGRPQPHPGGSHGASGIQTVMTADRFDAFVAAMFSRRAMGDATGEHERFFAALADGRARLSMLLEPQVSVTGPPRTYPAVWRQSEGTLLRVRCAGCDAAPLGTSSGQDTVRAGHHAEERGHLKRGAQAGMREAAPGKFEYEVEAAIEHVYLRSGAMSWGYPSIIGSGPNATILHYNKSNRRMEQGDLLLVDAAATTKATPAISRVPTLWMAGSRRLSARSTKSCWRRRRRGSPPPRRATGFQISRPRATTC